MRKGYVLQENKIVESSDAQCPIELYIAPDEAEKKYLTAILKIDEHTLNSSLDPNELGRVEFELDHIALITKRPKRYSATDHFLFRVESIGTFIFPERLIVVLSEDIPIFEGKVFVKVSSLMEVVLKIIYRSTIHFEEHIKVISMCSDDIEHGITTSVNNRKLLNMFKLEKSLVFYLEAISSNGRVIEKLKLAQGRLGLNQLNMELLDDIAIENAQCYEMAQIYSQVISGLMDAWASIISNNLNVMMKNLNALVIAVAIPTFFTGIGGMSEFTAFFGSNHPLLAYLAFFCLMVLLGTSIFFLIRKVEKIWKDV
jgi:magnesium transporter